VCVIHSHKFACDLLQFLPRFKGRQCVTHLCEVQIHEAEGEELQAHGETVEQPEGEGSQCVCGHTVSEIKREEERTQSRPQQTQEQKHSLVAEAFVSVSQHQPQLRVHERKEQCVEDRVRHCQTQHHERRHGRAESRQRLVLHRSSAPPSRVQTPVDERAGAGI